MKLEYFDGSQWVEGVPSPSQKYRKTFFNGGVEKGVWPDDQQDPIFVEFSLSKTKSMVGEPVEFTATFSQPLDIPDGVPISITDRNQQHVANVNCVVVKGVAKGTLVMGKSGDYTVCEEAVNFHQSVIPAKLCIENPTWLRVCQ